MQKDLCNHCKQPVKKGLWPQEITDYPNCWQEWENGNQFLGKNKKDSLFICHHCHSLWLLTWNYRDIFLEGTRLPNELKSVLENQSSLKSIWQLLTKYGNNHILQAFILQLAKNRYTKGNLNRNSELLIQFLSDSSLSLKNADMAIGILHSVIGAAARQVYPEKAEFGSKTREQLSNQLAKNKKNSDNIVIAANTAYEKWERSRPVQYLPPIRNMDIAPLLNWLHGSSTSNNVNEIINFRSHIRDLLVKIALQANRHSPVITIQQQSSQLLEEYHDRKKWLNRLSNRLKSYADNTRKIDNLTLMDNLVQLEQLLLFEKNLDANCALDLVTIAENTRKNTVKSSFPVIKKIDQILSNVNNKSGYSAKVKQRLKWFINR